MAETSAAMAAFTECAREQKLALQRCEECGAFAWPPREVCAACWADVLIWTTIAPRGALIAATRLHVAHEEFFRERLPWRVGIVRLDAGPVAYAHLTPDAPEEGPVQVHARVDRRGRGILVARPLGDAALDVGSLRGLIEEE